jgi:hypothetical protein
MPQHGRWKACKLSTLSLWTIRVGQRLVFGVILLKLPNNIYVYIGVYITNIIYIIKSYNTTTVFSAKMAGLFELRHFIRSLDNRVFSLTHSRQ